VNSAKRQTFLSFKIMIFHKSHWYSKGKVWLPLYTMPTGGSGRGQLSWVCLLLLLNFYQRFWLRY
jgi:hypothetical protein